MLARKARLAVAAAGAVLIVAGCSTAGDGDEASGPESQAATEQTQGDAADGDGAQAQSGAPNLDDIPDPVAEVNGTAISKNEFVSVFEGQYQQMSMQAQSTGQPVDEEQLKEQSLDGLVGVELLQQEAEKRGIEVTDQEIDESLAEFAETNQASTDEFIAKMGEQGLDRDDVLDQIEKQLRAEKLIADEFGEYSPTDDEIKAAYDQVAQQQAMMGGGQAAGQQVPPLEQVRPQVEEQVKNEKQAQQMQTLSDSLREGAKVDVHL